MKSWLKIAIGVVVVLLVAVLIVPLFVNADSFRPMLENQLSSTLGRKVTLGKLSFSFFSGSVDADQLTVADDPAFSAQPFLQAKSLKIGVNVGAMLFHHQIDVKKFVAESPEIHLISNAQGVWNYSSLGRNGAANSSSSSGAGSTPQLTVGDAEITGGKVVVSSIPAKGNPFEYDGVNIAASNVAFGQSMPFQLNANLPGNGTVALKGTAGPVNQQDASATPVTAQLTVRGFDPVKAGVLPASEGIGMQADIDAQVTSDGKIATSNGKILAHNLVLAKNGTPAPSPVNLNYTVRHDLRAQTGVIQQLAVQTGPVTVLGQGTYSMVASPITVNLNVNAAKVPVDSVEALLPAVGVRLPTGSTLKGGTLGAQIGITGPITSLVIAGPIEVDNTTLAGFDLASKIEGLKALSGTSGGTAIQLLKADVRETSAGTQLTNLDCVVPAIGTATGQGTVAASGALNFDVSAKLSGSGATGAAASSATSALGGVAGSFLHAAVGNASIPVSITGTTSNPIIRANVAAMLKGSTTETKKGIGGALKGLLGPR
jgi:AsmA protein